ncbi:MAG: DUF2851 family protein, partial [Akkermansia sp.]|nr:DUF2851 family protein [Akkermansia sp.]
MRVSSQQYLATAYRAFTEAVFLGGKLALAEESGVEDSSPLSEIEIQRLWSQGLLSVRGESEHHGNVRVLDAGQWNRGAGADFLRAEIEIGGKVQRGDIEIDPEAQD